MTAVNGAVAWSAKYTSFGKAYFDSVSTVENNLRFAGQYEYGETGLYYNSHRYYNSESGRYLQSDPSGFACKNPKKYPNTRDKFGKHPRPFGQSGNVVYGPGYVNREDVRDLSKADCRKKKVTPKDKKRMCGEGPSKKKYFLPTSNCHSRGNCRSK